METGAENDFSLKRLIELCESERLMNYDTTKEDPADLKSMIRLRKDFSWKVVCCIEELVLKLLENKLISL